MPSNRQILLISRPKGMPNEDNFKMVTNSVPKLKAEGDILVKTIWLSIDPALRGRMTGKTTYAEGVELNSVMQAYSLCQVVESRHNKYKPGDFVFSMFGMQDYALANGDAVQEIIPSSVPLQTTLGFYLTGASAYFGLLEVCKPKKGETAVVSAAAGSVGSTVGQIARIKGCRVVGITGSDEKVKFLLNELGYDAAVRYKKNENLRADLAAACPSGVDVYFDNTGGDISDAVVPLYNEHARVCLCGRIANYNLEGPDIGPRHQPTLIYKRVLMQGYLLIDYMHRYPEAIDQLTEWVSQGKLKFQEDIIEGLENAPKALIGLFEGKNIGKQLVKVAEPDL